MSYKYGVGNFLDDICERVGTDVIAKHELFIKYLRFMWIYVSPVICVILFFSTMVYLFDADHTDYICADPDASTCTAESHWGIGYGNPNF